MPLLPYLGALPRWNSNPVPANPPQEVTAYGMLPLPRLQYAPHRLNCQQLRHNTGQPGPFDQSSPHYRPYLDGDGDGLACEPYQQRER